eukprot:symbB.v1.2.011897.t1/scaffold806.1/size231046/24
MICAALLATVALLATATQETTEVQVDTMDAAWQDAKLILSFAVGIIFMRSLEMLTIDQDQRREPQPKTFELYPFLT